MSSVRSVRQRSHGLHGDYPGNWDEISKHLKGAAGNRCVRCFHPAEGNWKRGEEPETELIPTGIKQLALPLDMLEDVELMIERPVARANGDIFSVGDEYPGRMQCDMACRHQKGDKMRLLTVHHLDINKANVSWWNLAPLCQVCHLEVQAHWDWHQYYLVEPPHWMAPYMRAWELYQATGITVVNMKLQPFDQYIGRWNPWLAKRHPGVNLKNPWANPFKMEDESDRARVIAEYRSYILGKIAEAPEKYNLGSLVGTTCGCYCKPLACHGDVLVELVAEFLANGGVKIGDSHAETEAVAD